MSVDDTPPNNSAGEDRQFVHFSFYALDPAFRRLPAVELADRLYAALLDGMRGYATPD